MTTNLTTTSKTRKRPWKVAVADGPTYYFSTEEAACRRVVEVTAHRARHGVETLATVTKEQ